MSSEVCNNKNKEVKRLRKVVYNIVFESNTVSGKIFDLLLICVIVLSVLVVMLDSVLSIKERFGDILYVLEWLFTIIFTLEYFVRIFCVDRPLKYVISFYGIVDLLAIAPTYMSLFFYGAQYFLAIRILRILRVFRILKLVNYIGESYLLIKALKASYRKIAVFLYAVFTLIIAFGSVMYVIEGPENGFTSIPRSIYWAIVTITTVGYGQVAPQTPFGQFLASLAMIVGYAIIAVPTGIVTVEMTHAFKRNVSKQICLSCRLEKHDSDAIYCKRCGNILKY